MSVAGSFLIKLQQGSPAERQVLKKYLRKKFLNTFELKKKKCLKVSAILIWLLQKSPNRTDHDKFP